MTRKTPPSNSRQSMPKRYFALPWFLLQRSPDFGNKSPMDVLSSAAVRTLFMLMAQYSGWNNGDFSVAPSVCRKLGLPKSTARRGIAELCSWGLVVETRRGGMNSCGLYGLAWMGLDEGPSHKYDHGIEASAKPLEAWTLQYQNRRTAHLCTEHAAYLASRKGGRADRFQQDPS